MAYVSRVFHANALTRVFQDYRSFCDGIMDAGDALCSVSHEFSRIHVSDHFGYALIGLMFDEISKRSKS